MTNKATDFSPERTWVILEGNNVRKCKHHEGPDCQWCGGSGFRRKCGDINCMEHGCNGLGKCEISTHEVVALLTPTEPEEV